jgi:hypothetical protein
LKDHSHPEPKKCAHDIGWCEKCERPYCKSCGREWYEQSLGSSSMWEQLRKRQSDEFENGKAIRGGPISPWDLPKPQWYTPPTPMNGPGVVLCAHKENV